MSVRTGVADATEIVALTKRGLSGARPSCATSPTRRPLKSTTNADQQPGTGFSNANGSFARGQSHRCCFEPIDEAEADGDYRGSVNKPIST